MVVFHLKHRPRKVTELDLPEVAKAMKLIMTSKQRAASYLFAGPKGAGKTSAARILARGVNCENREGVESCGKCGNCKEILSGTSIDIIEIDGASNRGIDDVRVLKERAYLLPSKLKIKVFIIDEVHMLTKEAFNAFLKLIEEPPEHTLFVMCTTDPGKIPETVLSRLVRVDFRKGRREELLGSLDRVVKAEKIKMGVKSRELIISKSDGSFRNLHKMINEMFMEFGKKMGLSEVRSYFANRLGVYGGKELEEDLVVGETKSVLEKLEKLAENGVDFVALRCGYLVYFQKRLLAGFGIGSERGGLVMADLRRFLALLVAAGRMEREVEVGQLPLELVVVEFLADGKQRRKLGKKEKVVEEVVEEVKGEDKEIEAVAEVKKSKQLVGVTLTKVENKWREVLAAIKPFNHSVEAFMRSARPKGLEGEVLTLEVFYPFHKEKLEEEKNRKVVEQGLAKVFDCPILLRCVLSEGKKDLAGMVKEEKVKVKKEENNEDIYDVAKEIFG